MLEKSRTFFHMNGKQKDNMDLTALPDFEFLVPARLVSVQYFVFLLAC